MQSFITTSPLTKPGLQCKGGRCLGRPFSRPPPRARPAAMCLPARLLAVRICLCCVVLCCVLGWLLSLASATGLTPCLLRCCCMLLLASAVCVCAPAVCLPLATALTACLLRCRRMLVLCFRCLCCVVFVRLVPCESLVQGSKRWMCASSSCGSGIAGAGWGITLIP